jgi:hypothetical protein
MTSDRKSIVVFSAFGVLFVCVLDESDGLACVGKAIGKSFSTAAVKHEHPYTSSQVSIPQTDRSCPISGFSSYVTVLLSGPVAPYSRNISCDFGSSFSTTLRESTHDEDRLLLEKRDEGTYKLNLPIQPRE